LGAGAARTDVEGRLLRPPELLTARKRWQRGEIGPVELKRVDAAVDTAIRL
jgi:methionine synthase II (cobalamin-independent)